MSNAAKLKKKAAEFEQKKQFDKALQLYIQILDDASGDADEEADVALYNRVGDLLMRQGSVGDAVDYYEKAVDLYAESGFFNNAIALCNKILRQSPGRNSIYYKLGKISAKKGFISDAKQNFLEYADRMQKGGQLDEAFRALKEFADLCPDQDDIRLMLAEQLSKKDRKREAIEQLQHLYEKFVAEGRGAEARATIDRMKAIDPEAEPVEGAGAVRSQKSGDLVFLDLGDASGPADVPSKGASPRGAAAKSAPPAPAPKTAGGKPAPGKPGPGSVAPPKAPRVSIPSPAIANLPLLDTGEDDEAAVEDDVLPVVVPTADLVDPALDDLVLPELEAAPDEAAEDEVLEEVLDDDFGLVDPAHATSAADDGSGVAGFDVIDPDSPQPVGHLSGLMPSAEFHADEAGDADPVSGFEQTAMDMDLEIALPEILPELEPPLSGSEFARLPLDVAADVRAVEPPPHDLALPGRLPALDSGDRGAMSLTGEMELIIPERDDDVKPVRRAPPAPRRSAPVEPPGPSGAGSVGRGAARRPSEPLPVEYTPEVDTSDMAGRDADTETNLPLIRGAEELEVPADELDEADLPAWLTEPEPGHANGAAPTGRGDDEDAEEVSAAGAPALDDVDEGAAAGAGVIDDLELPVSEDETAVADAETAPRRHSRSVLARSVDRLRAAAQAEPGNWSVRRQYAEALLDDGDRDGGSQELETVMLGLERLADLEGAREVAEELILLNPNSVRHHQKRVEYAFRAADKTRLAEAYLELADALFRAGHAEKARVVYQRVLELSPSDARAQAALSTFAPPVRAAAARAEPAAPRRTSREGLAAPTGARRASRPVTPVRGRAEARDSDEFVNLSDWLREDDAPKSTRMVVDDEAPSGDEQADFAEMLRKFKQGVSDNVDDEDFESHYDLGVAYKEMGLVDEAIAQFQKALRGMNGRVRTYEALGQCFLEKQQFQVAASILGRAIAEPGSTDEQLVGVLYLLGYASEALRQWGDAVAYYQRVFAVDIQFRDVADRLAALERVPNR